MRIYAECTFLDSRTQARDATFSLFNHSEDRIHFSHNSEEMASHPGRKAVFTDYYSLV